MEICARKVSDTLSYSPLFSDSHLRAFCSAIFSVLSYYLPSCLVSFFCCSWCELFSRYKGVFLLDALIKSVVTPFTTEEKAQEVSKFFFEQQKIQFGASIVQQAVEMVRIRSHVISPKSLSQLQQALSQ